MRFEQIVEELYKKYTQAVSKEEKIEKVREKAKELGFENVEVEFNEKTVEARAVIELNEETIDAEKLRKLGEIAEWLVGESYTVHLLKLLIRMTEEVDSGLKGDTQSRAKQLGIKHTTFKQIENNMYADYFALERDDEQQIYVYLLVYNEYSE